MPHDDYKAYLRAKNPACLHPGDIVDTEGHVLGHHEGVPLYTIGQRKGLGIAHPEPLYVVDLDMRAVTPVQSFVFYAGDTVVGGGIIEKAIRKEAAE